MLTSSNSTPCGTHKLTHNSGALTGIGRSLTPSNSRPHTPPSSSKNNVRNARTPPPKANSAISSPPRKPTYSQLLPSANDDWQAGDDEEDDEEEEDAPQHIYSEGLDEDEFGLPSISSMRRAAKKRIPINKINDPGGGFSTSRNGSSSNSAPSRPSGRPRANSSDIAEERGPPSYPTTKKIEGKILRPQYKDILRG